MDMTEKEAPPEMAADVPQAHENDGSQPSIHLLQLQRTFQRGDMLVEALKGIDLDIEDGEFVALVGPSGSGKSTLLNLIGGLDHPTAGELWVDGVPLHTADADQRTNHRRHKVGFIFQSFNLLPRLTAVENVAVPLMLAGVDKEERLERAAQLLQRVGLGHRLDHYPTEMSGGEQQRTAVARALIYAANSEFSGTFKDSLPLSGTSGTLRSRLGNVRGKILGKTGSIAYVNSLAGYAQTQNETLAFVIIGNKLTENKNSSPVVDKIASALVTN